MKIVLNILAACAMLWGQVILFENTEWGIKYLNAHPGFLKPLPLLFGIIASFLFAIANGPIKNAKFGLIVSGTGDSKPSINPFWGWLIMCLIVSFVINLMLE